MANLGGNQSRDSAYIIQLLIKPITDSDWGHLHFEDGRHDFSLFIIGQFVM